MIYLNQEINDLAFELAHAFLKNTTDKSEHYGNFYSLDDNSDNDILVTISYVKGSEGVENVK